MMETIIVVIIIGILATLGLASYGRTVEKTKSQEAVSNLRLIRAGEKIYRGENARYYPSPDATVYGNTAADLDANINGPLRLNIDYRNYNFSITSADTGNTFTAQATRNSGSYINSCLQINQIAEWADCGSWTFGFPAD